VQKLVKSFASRSDPPAPADRTRRTTPGQVTTRSSARCRRAAVCIHRDDLAIDEGLVRQRLERLSELRVAAGEVAVVFDPSCNFQRSRRERAVSVERDLVCGVEADAADYRKYFHTAAPTATYTAPA